MKRLFNQYAAYTPEAADIAMEFRKLVKEFMSKYVGEVDNIDLEHIMLENVSFEMSLDRMKKGIEIRQKEIEKEKEKKKNEKTDL